MDVSANLLGHINNLYNTTFWALIQLGGLDNTEADKTLNVKSLSSIIPIYALTSSGYLFRRQERDPFLSILRQLQ